MKASESFWFLPQGQSGLTGNVLPLGGKCSFWPYKLPAKAQAWPQACSLQQFSWRRCLTLPAANFRRELGSGQLQLVIAGSGLEESRLTATHVMSIWKRWVRMLRKAACFLKTHGLVLREGWKEREMWAAPWGLCRRASGASPPRRWKDTAIWRPAELSWWSP